MTEEIARLVKIKVKKIKLLTKTFSTPNKNGTMRFISDLGTPKNGDMTSSMEGIYLCHSTEV